MQTFVVDVGTRIDPFERAADACFIGDQTLAAARLQTLFACGLTSPKPATLATVVTGPALVLANDVWVTTRALRSFLRVARASTQAVRMCLPASRLMELFLPLQDLPIDDAGRAAFDVVMVPAGVSIDTAALFALPPAQWRAPRFKEVLLRVPQPRYILRSDATHMAWPLTSTIAMRIRHWLHVLRAGHLAPQVALLERASAQPLRSLVRLLLATRMTAPARWIARRKHFSYRGKNVSVHPTATIEGSVVGDDVTVGAYAYVLNSIVGSGSVIEQRAHVSGCSLGPRTFVSLNSSLQACVTFGDTDACINGVQACVLAERCAATSFARPLDLSLTGPVRVKDGERLRDAGVLPCGCAFGEGVFLGANVTLAAGRCVVKGTQLVDDPTRLLRTLNEAPGVYASVDGAALKMS